MAPLDPARTEALLEESDWLRRLARGLVADAHRAEDAVQETLLAAWRRPPAAGRVPRAWLARVLRNAIGQERRSRARREAREAARAGAAASGAGPGAAPPADDVAARLELQGRLLAAVRALEEPYRTALVLRFLDGLPPRAIARRLGVPVKTVHSRLERGLAKLRARLSADFPREEGAWLAALLPFAEARGPLLLAAEGLAASTAVQLGAAALALGAGLWLAGGLLGGVEERADEPPRPESALKRKAVEAPPPRLVAEAPGDEARSSERRPVAKDASGDSAAGRAAPETPAAGAAPAASAAARIELTVVKRGTEEPVPGVAITVRELPGSREGGPPAPLLGPRAVEGLRAADASGRASLEVPPGRALRLTASPGAARRDFLDPVDSGELDVEPLAPGEERALVLALPHGLDRVFHGRVVAEEDGRPLSGATAAPRWLEGAERAFRTAAADPDGRFALPYPSWRASQVTVRAPGYGPRLVEMRGEDRPPHDPIVVRLAREAGLDAAVRRGEPARAGFAVRLSTASPEWIQPAGTRVAGGPGSWTAACDATGRAALRGLPARVPLTVEVLDGDDVVWRHREPLRLEPGEVRAVEWRLDGGASVRGEVRDAEGLPVAHRELWVLPADGEGEPGGLGLLLEREDRRRAARFATTDAQGRYEVAGLAAGWWWIGPGAAESEPDPERALAPYAVPFEVPPRSDPLVVVDFEAHRGLYVEGRVLVPEGRGLDGIRVGGWRAGDEGRWQALPDERGRFRLGPLVPGEYRVRANVPDTLDLASETTCEAGDRDLMLWVALGDSISGRVVDALTGEPRDGRVHVLRPDGGSLGMGTGGGAKGAFCFSGLPPGTYDVSASTDDGLVASLGGVVLERGRSVADLELCVAPAAWVEVVYAGPGDAARISFVRDGAVVDDGSVRRDEVVIGIVPPGPLLVQLYRGGGEHREVLAERWLAVEPGSRQRIEIAEPPGSAAGGD